MSRRGTPEADSPARRRAGAAPRPAPFSDHPPLRQRGHRGRPRGAKRQAILAGMGVHRGFADLVVLCDRQVSVPGIEGAERAAPAGAGDLPRRCAGAGSRLALVRSVDDALGALGAAGLPSRIAADPAGRAGRTEAGGGSSSAAARGSLP